MPNRPPRLKRPWLTVVKTGIAERIRDPFYHTAAWKRASAEFITEHPLCCECEKIGKLEPSKVTDHNIPKDVCADPWDRDNWRPLCYKHHSQKSAKDKKHFK